MDLFSNRRVEIAADWNFFCTFIRDCLLAVAYFIESSVSLQL